MMHRPRRFLSRGLAFVDTLGAVAVVAIAMSVLVPAVAKIKDPTRRAMCADNLRRLMTATHNYANDFGGKGPYRGWFSYDVAERADHAYGWGSTTTKVLINHGQLYPRYIAGKYDMLYCPASYATIRDSTVGWKTALNPSVSFTASSYHYAIIGVGRAGSPDIAGGTLFSSNKWSTDLMNWINRTWQPANPGKTFQIPNNPVLTMDGIAGGLVVTHPPGVNAAYIDGHVRFHEIGTHQAFGNRDSPDVWYKLSLKQ